MSNLKISLQKGGQWIKKNIWRRSKSNHNHISDICKSLIMIFVTYMILAGRGAKLAEIIKPLFS